MVDWLNSINYLINIRKVWLNDATIRFNKELGWMLTRRTMMINYIIKELFNKQKEK